MALFIFVPIQKRRSYLSAKCGFGVAAAFEDPLKANILLVKVAGAVTLFLAISLLNLKMDQFSTCQLSKASCSFSRSSLSKVSVKLDFFKRQDEGNERKKVARGHQVGQVSIATSSFNRYTPTFI